MFTAVFYRYYDVRKEHYETLSEAVSSLALGWEWEQLYISHIEKDGEVLFTPEETFEICMGYLTLMDMDK